MGYPKKTKGWRKIVVDGQTFRWRFTEDYYLQCGARVDIQAEPNRQQLSIALADHFTWVEFAKGTRGAKKNFFPITPKLTAKAILFGLANGWQPAQSAFPMRAVYEDGIFRVITQARPK
ncbi:MAG TPA: hypothetical protein VGB77_10080 [Abditibacteriaceae bacterium]|jgi:hypothetical protein